MGQMWSRVRGPYEGAAPRPRDLNLYFIILFFLAGISICGNFHKIVEDFLDLEMCQDF